MKTIRDEMLARGFAGPANTTRKTAGEYNSYSSTMRIGAQHPIVKMLGKHFDPRSYDDPRSNMVTSRILVWSLPFLRRALELHAEFIGNIAIETNIKPLREALETFIREVPIVNQANPEWKLYRGLNNFLRMMVMSALEDGLSFGEEMYEVGTDGIAGLMAIPSDKFCFKKKGIGDLEVLQFKATNGRIVEIQPSDHFHVWGAAFRPGALWGLPMIEGGYFFGEFLVKVLVARLKLHSRFGNPPSIDTFILKDSEGFQDEDYKEFVNRTDEVQQKLVEAQRASEEGQSASVVARMGGDIQHTHALYGDGATGVGSFDREYELLSKQCALITKIPVEFLGFGSGGGGIGSDKFVILNGILGGTVEKYRELLAPMIKKILRNHLMAIGAPTRWLEAFELGWTELDTNDEKVMAETAGLVADNFKKHLDNILQGFGNGLMSEEAIKAYLETVELSKLIDAPDLGKEDPAPEPPVPADPNPGGE